MVRDRTMTGNTFAEGSMVKNFSLDWNGKRYIVAGSVERKDGLELRNG
jgi:hypothetical protein